MRQALPFNPKRNSGLRGMSVLAVVVFLVVTACTTTGRAIPAAKAVGGITVDVRGVTARARDVGTGAAPAPDVHLLSHVYDITPSGPLSRPATITVRLARSVPTDDVIVIATRERPGDPWDYLPAHLSTDRTTVTFTTTHFSLVTVLGYDLSSAIDTFKRDFIDGIDGGATQTVDKPSCDKEPAARGDGYTITSDTTNTVYWCLGEDNAGKRILKVTDHRRYPLLVAHPNMRVVSNAYDWAQWSSLSRLDSGADAIIAPGGTAVFNADLRPGGSEGVQTQIDGLGQSLYALQTGVTTLVEILTRFGAGSGVKAVEIADKILAAQSCVGSLGKGSGAVIAGCFDAETILDAFGAKGLLLAPIMVAGPIVAFFQSEWNAIVDQFNGHSVYRVVISRAKPAVTLATFVGQWIGHTRGITITSDGRGTESIDDGCCDPIVDLTFKFSKPGGSPTNATAIMTVTSVALHDWPSDEPAPTVGQSGTLRLNHGVITEPITQTNYCDEAAGAQGTCGA
jgi:hypothetical protein